MFIIRYKLARAPNEDLDQPVHPRCLIRVFNGRSMGSKKPNVSSVENKISDQTTRMHRLISIFALRTCQLLREMLDADSIRFMRLIGPIASLCIDIRTTKSSFVS